MIIADLTVDPNGWTGLVTAITGMLTALGILIHAILSAVRGQKLSDEVQKNTSLTLDVAGKADAAAEKAAIAAVQTQNVARKVDQVAGAVAAAASDTRMLKDSMPK